MEEDISLVSAASHRDSPLSTANVDRVFHECLQGVELNADGSLPDTALIVAGVAHSVIFCRTNLAKNERMIGAMLDQLPIQFKVRDQGGDDGWSFLSACLDRDDNQWTTERLTVEKLIMLGIGTGQAKWFLPRELWALLPGGMPYVVVKVNAFTK